MLGPRPVQHLLQVVQEVAEVPHVAAHPVGATVAPLVECVHGAVTRCKPGADVVVATAVLAVAVDQHEQAAGVRRDPRAAKQHPPPFTGEVGFEPAYADVFHVQRIRGLPRADLRGQDRDSRRIVARASRTRSRYATPRISEPQK